MLARVALLLHKTQDEVAAMPYQDVYDVLQVHEALAQR